MDLGGEIPTDTRNGYHNSDVNLDGTIQYTGQDNDRDMILQIIGGEAPTLPETNQSFWGLKGFPLSPLHAVAPS